MRTRAVLLGLSMACGPVPLDRESPFGPYLTISGPVDPGVSVTAEARGFAVWVTSVDGVLRSQVQEVSVEPRPSGVAFILWGPPDAALGSTFELTATPPGPTAWGRLVLTEQTGAASVELVVNGAALLEGATVGSGERVVEVRNGAYRGRAEILLGVGGAPPPTWPGSMPWCRFSAFERGLVAYREVGDDCGGWEPVASAGERTEIQGVPVIAY